MYVLQHTLSGSPEAVKDIFVAADRDVTDLCASVRFQTDDAAAGRMYWGVTDLGAAPVNAGGYVDPGEVGGLVAIEPNTIDLRTLKIVGGSGDVVYITVM